jgi:hypothetical protein
MIKKEDTDSNIDRATPIELHHIDLDTQTRLLRVSDFLQKHSELVGISYFSVELLIAEKNPKVRNAAIKRIAAEILRRGDTNAKGFRVLYRKVTENHVRKILHAERLKEPQNAKTQKPQNAEIILKCPSCKKSTTYEKSVRNNVISFRATEAVDDTLTQLAKAFDVSRSYLVHELLKVDRRHGRSL